MIIRYRVTLLRLDNKKQEIISAPFKQGDAWGKYGESSLGIWIEDNNGARGFYHPQNYLSIITNKEIVFYDEKK